MNCPSCGASVQQKDINAQLQIVCPSCGVASALSARRAPERPNALKPEKVKVSELSDQIEFSWRWFRPEHLFLGVFSFFWFSFLIGWYVAITSMNVLDLGLFGLLFYLFPLGHVAVGVSVGYKALCGLLNKTTITLRFTKDAPTNAPFRDSARRSGTLTVKHSPIPAGGAVELSSEAISQVYCSQNKQKKGAHSIHLIAMLFNGDLEILLKDVESIELARYLEQQIESRLTIEDRPIDGETPK